MQPIKSTHELLQEVQQLITQRDYLEKSDLQVVAALKKINALAKVDAAQASSMKAFIYANAIGDLSEAIYWTDNIRKLNYSELGDKTEFAVLLNILSASKAAKLYETVAHKISPTIGMAAGLDSVALEAMMISYNQFKNSKTTPERDALNAFAIRNNLIAALDRLGKTEEDIRAIVDIASSFLLRKKLKANPGIEWIITNDVSGCGISIQIRLRNEDAPFVTLNDELIDLLVDNNLDRSGIVPSLLPGIGDGHDYTFL